MILMKPTVSSDIAAQLVARAVGHAEKSGWRVAVAVVDAAGIALALRRMDDVAPPIAEFALDKAFTSATMQRTTKQFFDRMNDAPSLRLGFSNRSRLIVWGGGLPLFHGGFCVGGIGVSGAEDFEDIACAETAVETVGLSWSR
jgi:uncharacterized protein GlcG (DUF336 family)